MERDPSASLLNGMREGSIILMLTIALFLMLALGTYSVGDPGWSGTGNGGVINNSAGAAGAWIADFSLSLLGHVAWLLPALLAQYSWTLIRDRNVPFEFDLLLVSIRGVGCVLLLMAMSTLFAIAGSTATLLPFGTGGMLGTAMAQACTSAFGLAGSQLLMIALMLFGVTISTDLSLVKLSEDVGRHTLTGLERLRMMADRWLAIAISRIQGWRNGLPPQEEVARERPTKPVRQRRERKDPVVDAQRLEFNEAEPVIDEAFEVEIKMPVQRPEPAARLVKEKQGKLFDAPGGQLPPLNLLAMVDKANKKGFSQEALEALSRLLELKLKDFGVDAKVASVYPGPVVTRFEIQPAPGTKVSKISNLAKDLARSLAVISVRVVEVIPGKSVVGIEIPNEDREMVMLGDVLASRAYDSAKSPLSLALGHDISGEPVVVDLAKMPHLLVAGTTGSGKSVGVNSMLISLLYKASPKEVRLMLVDPKMLELSVYEGIPHLLTPVITDMKEAANGLRWCVAEMERRYRLMAAMGVRNLAGFNRKITDAQERGEEIPDPLWRPDPMLLLEEVEQQAPMLETLPAIVVVIDEFADMMMIVGKKVEELIARIAQKARAAGIHLILATQRPSVDVITGLIKANIPTRIGFQVSSKIDSRTILDQGGAEQLLGHGDMLYLPPGSGVPVRVHGAFVSDAEVHGVVADLRAKAGPNYIDGILEEAANSPLAYLPGEESEGGGDPEEDKLYDEAVHFVTESRKASISAVQRKLRIGYNRAARMIESMEAAGVVSAMNSNGSREVLAPPPPRN